MTLGTSDEINDLFRMTINDWSLWCGQTDMLGKPLVVSQVLPPLALLANRLGETRLPTVGALFDTNCTGVFNTLYMILSAKSIGKYFVTKLLYYILKAVEKTSDSDFLVPLMFFFLRLFFELNQLVARNIRDYFLGPIQ